MALSVGGGHNTPNAYLRRSKTPEPSVLDMTLNNLMVRLWGMRSTLSLPSLQRPPWPGVVAPDRLWEQFKGQIELNCTYAKPNCLK